MDWALRIAFVLVPFGFLSMGIIHKGHLIAFFLAAYAIAGSQLRNIWLRLFVFYTVIWQISLLLNAMQFKVAPIEANLAYKFNLFALVSVVILLAVIKSKAPLESFYNLICIAALIQAGLGVLQLWNADPVFWVLKQFVTAQRAIVQTELTGTMGNPNFYAGYLAISLPFFLRKRWIWFSPLIALLILLSNTFTAMVACCVGCVYYLKDKIKLRWIMASLVPFLAWVVYHKQSWTIRLFDSSWASHDRLEFWSMALRKSVSSIESFVFGCGPGAVWGPYHGQMFPLHNDWLDVLFRFGLIGSIFISGAVYTIHRGNKLLYSAMLVACVDAIGNYPFHLAPSLFLILIIFGLTEREKYGYGG